MVWEDLTPQKILSAAAFDNAIRVHMALGGSTNAIIHVIAMARRAGSRRSTCGVSTRFPGKCR